MRVAIIAVASAAQGVEYLMDTDVLIDEMTFTNMNLVLMTSHSSTLVRH
jgi:hypothetical protein